MKLGRYPVQSRTRALDRLTARADEIRTRRTSDRRDPRPGDRFPNVGYVRHLTGRDEVPVAEFTAAPDRIFAQGWPLIGLIGKKRAGKDTFARGLIENGAKRFSFADNVRQGALDLDPWIRVEADESSLLGDDLRAGLGLTSWERLSSIVRHVGWEQAKEIREVRRVLQNFGTESIRRLDEDFWVRTAMQAATEHAAQVGPAVITDVRFPNEAEAVRAAGGRLIRIVRPGMPSDDQHPSEIALDDFEEDLTVLNVGDAEALVQIARLLPL